jgi:hypothetical protein
MAEPTDQQEIYVSIWAKVVDTQMHFNEMSVKSRQFGLFRRRRSWFSDSSSNSRTGIFDNGAGSPTVSLFVTVPFVRVACTRRFDCPEHYDAPK